MTYTIRTAKGHKLATKQLYQNFVPHWAGVYIMQYTGRWEKIKKEYLGGNMKKGERRREKIASFGFINTNILVATPTPPLRFEVSHSYLAKCAVAKYNILRVM